MSQTEQLSEKCKPWSTTQTVLYISKIAFINCSEIWWAEVATKSCSAEPSEPIDKTAQCFEIGSFCKTRRATAKTLLSFCLGVTYDTRPSPFNPCRWHIHSQPSFYLSSKTVCTTVHILSTCKCCSSARKIHLLIWFSSTSFSDTLTNFPFLLLS